MEGPSGAHVPPSPPAVPPPPPTVPPPPDRWPETVQAPPPPRALPPQDHAALDRAEQEAHRFTVNLGWAALLAALPVVLLVLLSLA